MKAYEIQKFGSADGLSIVERAEPKVAPGQVLVRIRATSLNYRDLMVLQGKYDPKMLPGRVPLSDGAGEVVAVGEGVSRFRVGDRVAGGFFQGWTDGRFRPEMHQTALGGPIDGVLAELVAFAENACVHLPGEYSFEEGATLPCAALTAWQSMFVRGHLGPGDTVLLLGTGGVSIFGLQLAKAAGVRAIITSSSDQKLGRARSLGADETINYRTNSDWGKAAAGLVPAGGVDHVIEVGGAGTFPQSVKACRPGASIGVIGILTGLGGSVELFAIVPKLLDVFGIYVGSTAMFEQMNRALTQGRVRPVIDRAFDFKEAPEAFRHLESGAHFGKIVIRV